MATTPTFQNRQRQHSLPLEDSTPALIHDENSVTSSSPRLITSESDPNTFYCHFCSKSYVGPNARSILRRHKAEKHGIALSVQKKGTRWDKDPNRPKTEAERRERTLESKRRYARRRRKQLQEAQNALKSISQIQENNLIIQLDSSKSLPTISSSPDINIKSSIMTPLSNNKKIIPENIFTPNSNALLSITNMNPPSTPKKSSTKGDLYKLLNSPLPKTPDKNQSITLPKLSILSSSSPFISDQENNFLPHLPLRSSNRNSPRNYQLSKKPLQQISSYNNLLSSPLSSLTHHYQYQHQHHHHHHHHHHPHFHPYSRSRIDDQAAWGLLALHQTSNDKSTI